MSGAPAQYLNGEDRLSAPSRKALAGFNPFAAP
jgi:hypothetical protein